MEPASLFQAFCALFGPKESGDKATRRDRFCAKKRRFGTVTRADGEMAWALGATFRRFDSSPVPRRADVLETGDFGGDKLSGLPRHVGEPRRADVLCGEHLGGLPRQTLADSEVCLGRLTR